MSHRVTGGCLCGAVRFTATLPSREVSDAFAAIFPESAGYGPGTQRPTAKETRDDAH